MSHRYPLLFVFVDAGSGAESAQEHLGYGELTTLQLGSANDPACVFVHADDLHRIDARLQQLMSALTERLAVLRKRYAQLTPREREALPLIAEGLLNKQAASILGISEATLQIHRGRIMQKMAARSFADLVRIADILGVVKGGSDDIRSNQSPGARSEPAWSRSLDREGAA